MSRVDFTGDYPLDGTGLLASDGAAHSSMRDLRVLIAGERNEDSATTSYLVAQSEATITLVDASGGDITDQVVSSAPALLMGWYITAGTADTLIIKDAAVTRFTETVAAGDGSTLVVPSGVSLRFESTMLVSLTTVATALIFWRPI